MLWAPCDSRLSKTDHAFQLTVELKASPLLYCICPDRDSATYHLSNHFRIKTPSLLLSKICLNLACSRGSRRHLWSLSVCDQILSFGEQTGRTWFFIVMTDFWHKQTVLSSSATWPLFLLPPDWSKNSCNSCFDVLWLYFDSRPDSDVVAEQTYVCLLAKNYIFYDSKRRKRSWK